MRFRTNHTQLAVSYVSCMGLLLFLLASKYNGAGVHSFSISTSLSTTTQKYSNQYPPSIFQRHHDETLYSSSTAISSTSLSVTNNRGDINGDDESSAECPFSMTFQRYRIPLSSSKDLNKNNKNNSKNNDNDNDGLFSGWKLGFDRSTLERKYKSQVDNGRFLWVDDAVAMESPTSSSSSSTSSNNSEKEPMLTTMASLIPNTTNQNKKQEQLLRKKGIVGVYMLKIYWRTISDVIDDVVQSTATATTDGKIVQILALPKASKIGLKRIVDICNWIEEEQMKGRDGAFLSDNDNNNRREGVEINVQMDEDAPVPTVIITATPSTTGPTTNNNNNDDNRDRKAIAKNVEDSTKSWVDRILVQLGICPFTKSNTRSGQGLSHAGVQTGNIAYHYSSASLGQIYHLMADTWEAIYQMISAGPSGKNGISSILLSAPSYNDNFSLFAGPVFAILEASVTAANAEPIVGVVCFHPNYATPDGNSWPGFGHMHSTPRLRKWVKEHDDELNDELTDDDVARGGAWQRRTPHATINVLRAEQLEVAERNRCSETLYVSNIRALYESGFDKLEKEKQKDQLMF